MIGSSSLHLLRISKDNWSLMAKLSTVFNLVVKMIFLFATERAQILEATQDNEPFASWIIIMIFLGGGGWGLHEGKHLLKCSLPSLRDCIVDVNFSHEKKPCRCHLLFKTVVPQFFKMVINRLKFEFIKVIKMIHGDFSVSWCWW